MDEQKRYPVFCDGNFHGWEDMSEIERLKKEAYDLALSKQESVQADHMIYGYYSLHSNGNIDTVHFYSGLPKPETEFDSISKLQNTHIYAIHKH